MIRRPPRSTPLYSSAASDVYKRQYLFQWTVRTGHCQRAFRSLGMLDNELFTFLEGTTDAAFSVNQQGEILSWNGASERLFGYSSSEVLGKSCFQILHGRGVLGTQVCHEGCSILECTGGRTEIANFDL